MTFQFSPKGYTFIAQSKRDVSRLSDLQNQFGSLVKETPDGCDINVDDMTALQEDELSLIVKQWRLQDAKATQR